MRRLREQTNWHREADPRVSGTGAALQRDVIRAQEAQQEAEAALVVANEKTRQQGLQASSIVSSLRIVCNLSNAITTGATVLPEPRVKFEPLRCTDLEECNPNPNPNCNRTQTLTRTLTLTPIWRF